MKYLIKFLLTSTCCLLVNNIACADNVSAEQRMIYFGFEGGIAKPARRSFKHKETDTKLTLKKSKVFSAIIGYSFYPQMAFELTGSYHPSFKLGYKLPSSTNVPNIYGETKVRSTVFMLNLVYDLASYEDFTPFVIGGIGVANLVIKPTTSSFMNTEVFRIKKSTPHHLAWKIGLGVSKEVVNNIDFNVSGKLHAVHNIKVKYDKLNVTTGQFDKTAVIKKTIGAFEITAGLTYRLPYKK